MRNESWFVPEASILLAGLLGSHALAEIDSSSVLGINSCVGTGVICLAWNNRLWHVPDATILLAGNLSCYALAHLDFSLVKVAERFVSTLVSLSSWWLVEQFLVPHAVLMVGATLLCGLLGAFLNECINH